MKKSTYIILLIAAAIVLIVYALSGSNQPKDQISENNQSGAANPSSPPPPPVAETSVVQKQINDENPMIILETNFGKITIELYPKDAPLAAANFLKLTNAKFYDGLTFHRVIPGFMIQGGDPSGNGTGGPGYTFEDELDPATSSYQAGYNRGVVAMANAGPDTNGSQFFIMHADYSLPHNYTIFGRVTSGMEVVDAIAAAKTDDRDKPIEPVVIKTASVQP